VRIRNAPILVKLTAVAVVAVLGVIVMAATRLSAIRPAEMEARQIKTRHLVESAQSVVAGFHEQETAGKLSRDEAQAAALAVVKKMRYEKNEYFWVNDMHPKMIMHPFKPELDGTDLTNNVDPNGKHLFVAFVDTVRAKGAGFVSYLWPKPGLKDPVPKISYVSGFAPWGWVIGSGIYIDDVDTIVTDKRNEVVLQTLAVLMLLLVGVVGVGLSITRPVRRLTLALGRLATGDTDIDLPPASGDEIGRMSSAVEVLRGNTAAKQALELEKVTLQEQAQADKRRAALELATQLDAAVSGVLDRITDAVGSMQQVATDLSATTGNLTGSVREISGRASESTEAAARAAQEADEVSGTVTGLTSAADTIGGVIAVIRKVAAQTNLLALNATIEAARAGELGKGFAVVANEVKELAQQSAHATDRIAAEVEAIQATSQEAANVMARMADTVRSLGSATQDVASAIAGTSGDDRSVQSAAEETGVVAQRIQHASSQLTAEADRLRTDFAALLARITAE